MCQSTVNKVVYLTVLFDCGYRVASLESLVCNDDDAAATICLHHSLESVRDRQYSDSPFISLIC